MKDNEKRSGGQNSEDVTGAEKGFNSKIVTTDEATAEGKTCS
jgi:hypothetical protein